MHRIRSILLLWAIITLAHGAEPAKDKASPQSPAPVSAPVGLDARARLMQKMDEIILPTVHFENTTLEQAIEFLRKQSRELDKSSAPSGSKGVNIILRLDDTPDTSPINLNVKNLQLSEAIRYVTELTQTKYRVEHNSVLIVPISAEFETELHTRTFKVPPDFLSNRDLSYNSKAAPFDPFTSADFKADSSLMPITARQTLESAGVHFSKGTSASFNCLTGHLTVTNTQPNLDLVEGFIDAIHREAPVNIALTVTVIEGPGELIRQAATAAKSTTAFKELSNLLAQAQKPGSNVRVISDAFLEAQSGVRSIVATVHEHTPAHVSPLGAGIIALSAPPKPRKNGLQLSIEPSTCEDRSTIKAAINLTLSTPASAPQKVASESTPGADHTPEVPLTDIPVIHLGADAVIKDGDTSLLCVTSPLGMPQEKADTLCAVFLTAKLRTVEALPPPQPQPAPNASMPSGMKFTALDAPAGLFDEFLPATPPTSLKNWLTEKGITFPEGSSIEQRGDQLWIVNTPDNISCISSLIDQLLRHPSKNIACTLHTLEAPAPFLRDLAHHTLASADDSAMFAAIEAAAARGEASFIDSAFLPIRSGSFATRQSAREQSSVINTESKPQQPRHLSFDRRMVGSMLDITADIGADSKTLHVTYEHELHPASQHSSGTPAAGFHFHKTSTTSSLTSGSIKLISLTPPPGREQSGKLWATFLKCDVVPILIKQPKLSSPQSLASSSQPEKMIVKYFTLEDVLSASLGSPAHTNGTDPSSPPSPSKEGITLVLTTAESREKNLQQTFESYGASFPPGSYVRMLEQFRGFIVRNTPANLAKISFGKPTPGSAVITAHIFQAPGSLLRQLAAQAARKSDHRAELDQLLATVKDGEATHLVTARFEALSGTFSTLKQGVEHTTLTGAFLTKDEAPEIVSDHRNVGFKIELTPTIAADGKWSELTIASEFDTTVPFEHRARTFDLQNRPLEFPLTDYFTSRLRTEISLPSGTARLLSLYKPTGKAEFEKEDILQAIFITCDILRLEDPAVIK
ncbi:hypothetical protein [Prosthecobacter fluviatilis]|uniref:Bacterial type II/III secretion system short domain protein n=1 Tax=Prosthecobacter fluviatilis TaxID=445931 RepID=A0ABW0KN63_9BACT